MDLGDTLRLSSETSRGIAHLGGREDGLCGLAGENGVRVRYGPKHAASVASDALRHQASCLGGCLCPVVAASLCGARRCTAGPTSVTVGEGGSLQARDQGDHRGDCSAAKGGLNESKWVLTAISIVIYGAGLPGVAASGAPRRGCGRSGTEASAKEGGPARTARVAAGRLRRCFWGADRCDGLRYGEWGYSRGRFPRRALYGNAEHGGGKNAEQCEEREAQVQQDHAVGCGSSRALCALPGKSRLPASLELTTAELCRDWWHLHQKWLWWYSLIKKYHRFVHQRETLQREV